GIDGGLLAAPRLSETPGVEAVKRPVTFGNSEVGNLCQGGAELFSRNPKIGPARAIGRIIDDTLEELFAKLLALFFQRGSEYQEARLRRNRHLGMRVEHEPEQRRSRPRRADDNRHWRNCGNGQNVSTVNFST